MVILYVGMKFDYGDPSRGLSFEHCNFYETLRRMGYDLLYFDFPTLLALHGRERMNAMLVDLARRESPDLLFSLLAGDEIAPETIQAITEAGIRTINWFCDDHWRFESFSARWAPAFRWVVTTAVSALPKYERMGIHPIKSQWACNPFSYRSLSLPLAHDVTFIGQPHGDRREWIKRLADRDIVVKTWGQGWENGRLDQESMIRVFNQSRINLNLSNASATRPSLVRRAFKRLGRPLMPSVAKSQQIKGRDFEVPGCGGFLLTGRADNIDHYYEVGREIICYDSLPDLVDKIRYYLAHNEERAAIAKAGYERTRRDHTYVHRLVEIFRVIGIACKEPRLLLDRPEPAGQIREAA